MDIDLKKELEATKSALRLQTIRCRQLVSAFTRKLHEKEAELRASKDLRDQQLSRLLRALLVLESRLRKEQKLIRQQLDEKDLIIQKQGLEISKYKQLENERTRFNPEKEKNQNQGEAESEIPATTGEERLDNLCKGLLSSSQLYLHDSDEKETNNRNKNNESTYKDNPVLESVNQILLRDEEELLKDAKPVSINLNEKVIFNGVEDSNEWYETNSNTVPEERTNDSAWCIKIEEGEEVKPSKDPCSPGKASPVKSQHMEEKACLEMSKKNLTVVDLEEIDSKDRAVSPAKSTASYEEIIPVTNGTNFKPVRTFQKPPALPPKPARLLKPHQILQQQSETRQWSSGKDCQSSPPALQSVIENQESKSQNCLPAINIKKLAQPGFKKPVPNSFIQVPTNTRHRHPESKSMKSSEGNKTRSKPPDTKSKRNSSNSYVSSTLELPDGVSQFSKQKEEPVANCGAIKIGSSVSSLIIGSSRDTIVTELNGESSNPPDDSHVSQLVRQFEVLGKYSDGRSEDVNDIRKNFEEFKLEDSYVDIEENGRHDGDGAENKNLINYYATLTIMPPPLPKEPPPVAELEYKMYETFLENTGLSQKSILTPSRMLSNHRSCLKPKDVKHRNRVKAAAAIEKCNMNAANGAPTVKYWTEPFL